LGFKVRSRLQTLGDFSEKRDGIFRVQVVKLGNVVGDLFTPVGAVEPNPP
jgi:hypothetical protein